MEMLQRSCWIKTTARSTYGDAGTTTQWVSFWREKLIPRPARPHLVEAVLPQRAEKTVVGEKHRFAVGAEHIEVAESGNSEAFRTGHVAGEAGVREGRVSRAMKQCPAQPDCRQEQEQ